MWKRGEKWKDFRILNIATFLISIGLTGLLAASVAWKMRDSHNEVIELAKREAVSAFNKDEAFRLWVARRGGIYVPESGETPPNPYLSHVPDHQIVTTSGKRLILMNSAYVLRQTMEDYNGLHDVKGHITSTELINPANEPDAWEMKALAALKGGKKEVVEQTEIDGRPHLRFMRPLVVQKECLKCHGNQGYKVGDIRGGVGIIVPLAPFLATESGSNTDMLVSHFLIWILGMGGIGFGYYRARSGLFERMEAKDALLHSKRLLDEAQHVAHLGSWELDPGTNGLVWSDEVYRIFGFAPNEIAATYEAFLGCVHPEDRERVNRAFSASLQSDEQYDMVHRILRPKTGEIRHVHEICEHFRDAAGKVVRSVGTVHDVTERHRSEELEHLLSSIVQSSDDAIIGKDPDGIILSWNRGAERMYGYTAQEAVGRCISMLIPPDKGEDLREILNRLGREERIEHLETARVRKDGQRIFVSLTISPIRDKEGRVVAASTIARDMTERRNLESQLRQSQKMEALGTLTGGIAHDFNNILTAIIGFASVLESKIAVDDPLAVNVTQILMAAERAAGLTRSLVAFSRKETTGTRPVNLNGVIAGMKKMLGRLMREDIELELNLAGDGLTIMADAGQIEQVLLNLAANARDAMPGGGTISITTGVLEMDEEFIRTHGFGSAGSYAFLVFSDTGEGIEEGARQRIFDPFFTTKEVGKGTGLGLSIVYGIIKRHKGYINCYSEPGHGTTFRIYLPLCDAPEAREAKPADAAPGGRETVLLAEDDPTVRSLIAAILKEFGYSVIEARDGEDAIASYMEKGDGIDLCLFDIIMPKKKGGDAFEEIRKINPAARAVFISGYQADQFAQNGIVREGTILIAKPVVPRELLRRVREVLDA